MRLVRPGTYTAQLLACGLLCGFLNLVAGCSGGGGGGGASSTGSAPTINSIEITPANAQLAAGTKAQLTATAVMSDSTHKDVTAQVAWASSNTAAVTIGSSGVSSGLATALSAGSTTISATTSGVMGQTKLAVTSATLTSIEVTPPSTSAAKGTRAQFRATGVFSDHSAQNLTSQVTWSSSDAAVATISSAAGSNGLALATDVGSTHISASFNGVTSPNATLTVTAATLVSIQVTPPAPSTANGLTQQFTAIGVYTDNSTQDLTQAATWSSSNIGIASISNGSGSNGLATATGVGSASISASFNGVTSPNATLTVTAATLVSIQVTPPAPSTANGLTQQFTATGVYTDNSTQNLTHAATWSSSNLGIATISNASGSNGLASAAGTGSTNISASFNGVTSPNATLTVTAATLVSIQVTPPAPNTANGLTQQFTATGVYTDNSTQDLTQAATWASSNLGIATISNASGSNGLASAAGTGSTNISASFNGVTSPNATLTVTAATLVSIQVTPPAPSTPIGLTQQFTATGVYTDNSTQDLTQAATWSSSNLGVATISNASGSNGLATATGVGSASISASFNGVTSPNATLTVTAATLVSIQVTPPAPSTANGLTQQFTATGVYTDNSTQDLTHAATWSSSNLGVATISNASGSNGLATATGVGSASISASFNGVTSPNATLTVTAATLVSIQVTPPAPNTANGLTQQFTATGVYTDNSTQDLTSVVTWSSSDTSVASISNAAGSSGLATATGVGSVSISASFNGVTSPSATLTVTAATLVSIQVTPPAPSTANGLTQQFSATGTYTDNSTQDLTSVVTWGSSDTSVASISNAAGSSGLATAAGVGSVSISASFNGVTSPSATLTVTAATLVSIQVTPPAPSTANGLTQQFSATGTYTDNSTQDLTSVVTWGSSDTSVASISNAAGSSGLATAAGVGSVSISASFNGVTSPSATLTVTAATLVSIQVTPPAPSTANGLTQQFSATGTYTDNSTQDLTAAVTWASSDGSVASISNAAGSSGLATATGVGSASISASFNGVTSPSATLTVTAATLVSIQVTPPAPSTANGLTQQFSATGTYTDNSTQDLTAAVTWASSDGSVASISNAAGSSGLATATGVGSASISASFNGVTSPSATLTVTAATLVSIQVTPPAPSTANGLTQQFSATGVYTDNSTQDLTSVVTWGSSNTSVASISNAAGSSGLATATGVGSASISASFNGVTSPSATLTVTAATLVSIQVSPSSASIANGATQPFTATGTYMDNSTQDLTAVATWASSSTAVATISNAAGFNGLATAAGLGSTNISASFNGVTSPSATLTVVAPTGAAGIWTATPAPGETAGMISDGAGNFYFFTSTATCLGLYNGTLAVAGSTISGTGYFIPDVFGPNSGCPVAAHEKYSGSLVPGVSMTLTATPIGGGGTSSTFTWTFDPTYAQASALTLLAGSWTMPGGSVASISSTGVIAAQDAATGCTITGQVSVSNTTVNLYNVRATYSGCTGGAAALNGVSLSGLGTLDNSVTPSQFDAGLRSSNKKTMSDFIWTQQ